LSITTSARFAGIYTPVSAGVVTSYANPLGSGDRTGLIALSWTLTAADPVSLINGNLSESANFFGAFAVDGTVYQTFDFGSAYVVDEVTFYQELANAAGTWQWQGSNDGSSWTNIGSPAALGGATTNVITALAGNTKPYRHLKMLGVSGACTSASYIYEFEFKISA
jgi:hypothetical protein